MGNDSTRLLAVTLRITFKTDDVKSYRLEVIARNGPRQSRPTVAIKSAYPDFASASILCDSARKQQVNLSPLQSL
jgi:hypothetical protein